jgi:hypothetical protein
MLNNPLPFARFLLLSAGTTLLLLSGCQQPPASPAETVLDTAPADGDWMSLFNGVNLDGWEVKINGYELNDNFANTYVVEDSMIKVQYSGYEDFGQRYGHLFYKEPFSYYRLRLEYRFVGDQCPGGEGWALRNSGVMLHGQAASTMLKDQDFPISIEAQFLGGDGQNERHTLNLCTPGTNVVMNGVLEETHCIDSKSRTYHGEQWVTAEFLVLGDSLIRHILDGEVVLEYSKPQIGSGVVNNFDPAVKQDGKLLTGGTLSLQSESHPIHFRNIELLNLEGCMDQKAKNFKPYYVKAKNSICVY